MSANRLLESDSVDDALARVLKPGQDIVVGQAAGAPLALIAALRNHRDRLRGSRILLGMLSGPVPELPDSHVRTFFPAGVLGTAEELERRSIAYERLTLYQLARGLADGHIAVDVVLAQGTPLRQGAHSLGASVDYVAAAAARASAVILETNIAVPWTGPRSTIAADNVIAVPAAVASFADTRAPSARHREIARHVGDLVPNHATIQLGMGPWVHAVVESMAHRTGLRVHSGLLGDWVRQLEDAGALHGDAQVVATGASGDDGFYRYLNDSDRIELAGAHETHDPRQLAELPKLHAINSALEVDLFGQANTEIGSAGRRGGIGGLPDFAHAASASSDGLSVIALSATAGEVSRVVPQLKPPAVSLASGAIDVIVTEYGSAHLRGVTDDVRAARIIAISAPAHRDWLRRSFDSL